MMRFWFFGWGSLLVFVWMSGCATAAPPPSSPPPLVATATTTPTLPPTATPAPLVPTPHPPPARWAEPCPIPAFYISPTGSDETGDGSEARPWATLRHAGQSAQPGTTICVRGGVYTTVKDSIIAHGTAEQPILIRPYPGEQPIFDGTGANISHIESVLLILHASHLVVEGLEVRNSSGRGISVYESEHITVQHNQVHHVQTRGIGGGGDHITFAYNHIWEAVLENENNAYGASEGWAGALASYGRADNSPSTNITMRGNLIHNVWGEGMIALRVSGVVVEDNTVYDAYSVNLYIDKAEHGRFTDNYLYTTTNAYNRSDRTYPAHGITLSNEGLEDGYPNLHNLLISNNVIVGTGAGISYWHYPYAPTFANNTYGHITITHNLVMDTQFTAIAIDPVPTLLHDAPQEVLLANNIIFAGKNGRTIILGNPKAWTLENNVWPDGLPNYPDPTALVIDPALVNPVLGGPREGFQVVAGSVASGRGVR